MKQTILVWDWPVRVFHWSLALSFALAFVTGDSERWRDLHLLLGYTVLGLVAFRLLWGFVGSRYSRFADFIPHPLAALRYLAGLLRGDAVHPPGHNPAGAVVIVLLLALASLAGLSGWALEREIGGDWLEELHEISSDAMLAVVLCHIAGVAVSSFLQRENLIAAMFNGKKQGEAGQGIASSHPWLALLMLAALAAAWIWAWPARF